MNKKVLLIQPRHGVWDGVFIRFPESVLSIAALPYAKGYDVTILDYRVIKGWKNSLINYLKDTPICVGITSLTGPSLEYAIESINIIKEINPLIPVIFGGVHATLLPEQTLLSPGVDIVIKGEAEYSFCEVIQVLENKGIGEAKKNGILDRISGIYYVEDNAFPNNVIKFTGEPGMIESMDELPDTPYELLDITKYDAGNLGNGVSASFQTSRGCPYACKFCGNEILQKRKMRTLSVSKVVKKIKMLQQKYGYNSFVFVDDLTIAGRKHFLEFTTALSKITPAIMWTSTGIRANLISKLNSDDLGLLWKSGCRSLDIGIESGSERILKYINKADSKENMMYANRILNKYPFIVKYTFIVGYPTETESEVNETLDFLFELQKENPNVYPMVFVYLPIDGTLLYDEIISGGFHEPTETKDWISMDSTSWFYHHKNWLPNYKRRQLETIMISSPFCSNNAKIKFTTFLGKIAFNLYHPIAKLRFKHRFFKIPIESYLLHIFK